MDEFLLCMILAPFILLGALIKDIVVSPPNLHGPAEALETTECFWAK